jgi:hypothetical protein
METTNLSTETAGQNHTEARPGEHLTRREIIARAERFFPSHLRPSLPSEASAFDIAKTKYIKTCLANLAAQQNPPRPSPAPENQNNPQTSGRCGRNVDDQPPSCGRDADEKRTTSGRVRTDADDADENPVPPRLQSTLDFLAKYQSDKSELAAAALDLRSPLDHLSPEKQSLLYEAICEFGPAAMHRVVTLPAPAGWGLDISESSIKRFRIRYAKRSVAQKRFGLKQTINEILADAEPGDERYTQAAERLLKVRLVETVNDPVAQTSQIRDLYQTLNRIRLTDRAEKRLHLAEQKQKATQQ